MSKYTTEVRYICEVASGLSESVDGASVGEVISSARTHIFDFDYPIFDEAYKEVLETKILRHFYTREIGLETVGLWKLKLETRMNDIMPYYNKLYESELIEFNPMYDTNYTKSGSESLSQSEITSLSTSESESISSSVENSNSAWNLYQDTPQNGLSDVESMAYLTNATKDTSTTNGSSLQTTSSQRGQSGGREALDSKGYLESIVGYRGNNPSKLLKDYRDTFLNIDLMIIGQLENLFMGLW